jgi:hypothetical protein
MELINSFLSYALKGKRGGGGVGVEKRKKRKDIRKK